MRYAGIEEQDTVSASQLRAGAAPPAGERQGHCYTDRGGGGGGGHY